MQLVGFFRELPHGMPAGPSILDKIDRLPTGFRVDAGRYLRSGHIIVAAAGVVPDVLSMDARSDIFLAIHSDGAWAWPSDFPIYVERYGVEVPSELLARMDRFGWTAPAMSEASIMKASDDLLAALASAERATL